MIRNFEALAINDLRRDALAIAEAGYEAINTGNAVASSVRINANNLFIGGKAYSVDGKKIFFVGVGKCAFAAAASLEKVLGDKLTAGIALDVSAIDKDGIQKIETYIGTHPLPSEINEDATKRIIEFLTGRNENDLVIFFISGGGSTLLCLHDNSMTCADESELFKEMTARGAQIQDINTVRKHISRARGGALAAAAYPAEIVSLIVSDVPGNDVSVIASGPTVLDSSSVEDARAVLEKYAIQDAGAVQFIETPKDEKYFSRVNNVLFLSGQDALIAMSAESARRGYLSVVADDSFAGEASEIGHAVLDKLRSYPSKTALLYSGESTVKIGTETGAGGRNQELPLSVLRGIGDNELILSFATDGRDNTDHAGAIADATTRAHAIELNIPIDEYLGAHRSYDFFSITGDALITGYTGSNVSDLVIALKR